MCVCECVLYVVSIDNNSLCGAAQVNYVCTYAYICIDVCVVRV